MSLKKWASKEDKILLDGYENEIPLGDLAKKLGRSVDSVKCRAYALRKEEEQKIIIASGACSFCGQSIINADFSNLRSERAANELATSICECIEAKLKRDKQEQISNAKSRIRQLFGKESEVFGFSPIENEASIAFLDNVVLSISERAIGSCTVTLTPICRATISITSKGIIKVARTDTNKYELME